MTFYKSVELHITVVT